MIDKWTRFVNILNVFFEISFILIDTSSFLPKIIYSLKIEESIVPVFTVHVTKLNDIFSRFLEFIYSISLIIFTKNKIVFEFCRFPTNIDTALMIMSNIHNPFCSYVQILPIFSDNLSKLFKTFETCAFAWPNCIMPASK